MCSHVRLYSFAGTLIVDGHEENAGKTAHNIEAEHPLLAELVAKGDRLERLGPRHVKSWFTSDIHSCDRRGPELT